MTKKDIFSGTGVALITPFRKQETIDFSKLEELIDNVITSGVDYIVALGTTSEAATMTDTERHALHLLPLTGGDAARALRLPPARSRCASTRATSSRTGGTCRRRTGRTR